MARKKQIFVAPGDEDLPLPIEKSPWHFDRDTYISGEHWDVIVEFAQEKMLEFRELLYETSYLDGDFSNWTDDKTNRLYEGLQQKNLLVVDNILQTSPYFPPLTPNVTSTLIWRSREASHCAIAGDSKP